MAKPRFAPEPAPASPSQPQTVELSTRPSSYTSLLEAIVESSDDVIISKDLTGTITSWNRAAERVFGYTASEIVGKSVLTLIPPDLHMQEPVILSKLMAGQRIEHFETIRMKKSGERIDVSLTISPIRDHHGKVVGASKILRDISELKRLQKSLLQAEKLAATGRMAASIAHEINNPLEGLLNLIYLAKNSAEDPDQVRSLLHTAEGELARVAHIARQTLGYYRENVSAASVTVPELVTETLRVYGPRLKSAGVAVVTEFSPTPALLIKRGEIMQVISNLVANSLHAMPEGGRLTLAARTTRREGHKWVKLDIADTGPGIPPANLQRIFEPFFTTRSAIGTGIGLWIARSFVEGHGGLLEVSSSTDAGSHGTTMSIILPVPPLPPLNE